MRNHESFELVIVGGGLAGLMAALRAERFGLKVALVDSGVPGTKAGLGGFAPFSGAKFSLFPAGSGLAPLVGGIDALMAEYAEFCHVISGLGFPQFDVSDAQLRGEERAADSQLAFRSYHSILLSPDDVQRLLGKLGAELITASVLRTRVTEIELGGGPPFAVVLENGATIFADRVIVAAGRLGSDVLLKAGVSETTGKGIDLGVRLEFKDRAPLARLRALGPDAKFMADGMRTFCLNSPGKIFHYPALGFSVPGGIVADPDWQASNVGILYRLPNRKAVVSRLQKLAPHSGVPLSQQSQGLDIRWESSAVRILGFDVVSNIGRFLMQLENAGLITLPAGYSVHYPLLDWHWPVFSLPGKLSTRVPGVLAAGDASGHARGLLQAAIMGSLAVGEAFG